MKWFGTLKMSFANFCVSNINCTCELRSYHRIRIIAFVLIKYRENNEKEKKRIKNEKNLKLTIKQQHNQIMRYCLY